RFEFLMSTMRQTAAMGVEEPVIKVLHKLARRGVAPIEITLWLDNQRNDVRAILGENKDNGSKYPAEFYKREEFVLALLDGDLEKALDIYRSDALKANTWYGWQRRMEKQFKQPGSTARKFALAILDGLQKALDSGAGSYKKTAFEAMHWAESFIDWEMFDEARRAINIALEGRRAMPNKSEGFDRSENPTYSLALLYLSMLKIDSDTSPQAWANDLPD